MKNNVKQSQNIGRVNQFRGIKLQ